MKGYKIFRLVCLALLWIIITWGVVANQPFTPRLAFFVIVSGIVVFVPVYKKYVKNGKQD